MHLATHPNGAVGLCCEADTLDGYGLSGGLAATGRKNLHKHSLEEVINSENFNHYRKEMLSGVWPKPCYTCKNAESIGLSSKRIRENNKYLKFFPQTDLTANCREDGSLKTLNFGFIELRLANTCNSACVTCNPVSSSRWIPDSQQLAKELSWFKNIYTGVNNWTKVDGIFESIAQHSNALREIYINGGEPTLIPEHFVLLEKLVENKISQNIVLHYSINATRLSNELINYWEKFKLVRVSCSIDDVDERNTYIRYPTPWLTVCEVMHRLNDLRKSNIQIGITQTVSIFNGHRLNAFKDYVAANWGNCGIYHNYLNSPTYLQPNLSDSVEVEKFKQYVLALDKIRATDFVKTFPELAEKYDFK